MKGALVTGSGDRIGRYIATFLARNGYNILLHCNVSSQKALFLKQELQQYHVKVEMRQADFRIHNEIKPLFLDLPFPINLLINNAAIFKNDSIADLRHDILQEHLDVNCIAPAILMQVFYKYFKETKDSSHNILEESLEYNIINILDYSIFKKSHNFFSYCLSKSSLKEATFIAAKQLAPNIRVNGIALGQTLQHEGQSSDNFYDAINDSPLRRQTKLKEISSAINFILDANSMTGQIIKLDSGMHFADSKYA